MEKKRLIPEINFANLAENLGFNYNLADKK